MVFPATTPPRRPRFAARRAAPALGLALAGSLLAGCGGTGAQDAGPTPASGSPVRPPSSSATPVSPDPTTGGSESVSASPRPAGLTGRLIGADQVPAFGGVTSWSAQSTGPAGPEPSGICQEYDFATIGATSAVVRTFTDAEKKSSATAAERVVAFPDATNAARAAKVLASFRDRCQARLRPQLPHLRVGEAHDVPVRSGSASAYTASWTPPGQKARHTQEVGTVLRGKLVAVVTLETDATPSGGQDPMAAALSAAAELLG